MVCPSMEVMLAEWVHEGHRQVLVAPIGIICDYVKRLYRSDMRLNKLAKAVQLERNPMLKASAALIDVLTSVVEAHESSLVH
jgi:ferrochelatase